MTDNINQPAHYTAGGIETIDVIEGVLGKYDHRDQVEKYNQRAHLKGNFQQDLEKARWYLNRTIENCEKGKLDPVTGARVAPVEEQPVSRFATDLDTDSVYKDDDGDFWVYNYQEERWYYYRMNAGEVTGKTPGGFTQHAMAAFTRAFFTRVEDPLPIHLAVLRYETDNEEEADEPEVEIELGVTPAADMPVGTIAYRDGERFSYNTRKEENGWVLSHQPFFYHSPNEVADNWFKNEPGWSLTKPSDVYKDDDGDYWAHTDDGWRWHCIIDGELLYRSIRSQEFADIKDTYSLEKLSDDDARRVRRIIREGEK